MLKKLTLKGFKSIKEMELELRSLNILIGANGAGKSNLVSFFKMLNEMMAGRLQEYIAVSGRSESLLYFGSKITLQIEAELVFEPENGMNIYKMRLFHAAGDTLIFAEETLSFLEKRRTYPRVDSLGAGHQETLLSAEVDNRSQTARNIKYLLNRCRVYHFHDTSSTAGVRQSCYVGDNRWLMPDAGNLAAMLFRFRNKNDGLTYRRIVETIRLIAPFFKEFVLEPDVSNRVILNWLDKSSDRVFGPHQLSDGTLRAICLIALLLQPEDEFPKLIVVDEPELGLHPYALNAIAGLFGKASYHTQFLISTQSSIFLDNFEPEDIIVVDRKRQEPSARQESVFKRLDATELEAWLEEYSLGEIWEKNVIGGGPH
ncbi:MAG: AAA family ATPase [Chloroflexaceae bacterium]|nr:AAA family ATPase [Chloroflexaceae bacterium]